MQLFSSRELLAFHMLKRCATDKDLEECYTEGPDIGFACVVEMTGRALRRKVLHNWVRNGRL